MSREDFSREYFLKFPLLSNPLRSLNLNGGVEQAHRNHTEEFYEVTEGPFEFSELLEWERTYNARTSPGTGLHDIT